MSKSVLEDAFVHHVWATLQVIDACQALSQQQVQATVPGTYGPILDTLRHLVAADARYLFILSGGEVAPIDASEMGLPQLRAQMTLHGDSWAAVLARDLDPAAVMGRVREDGSETQAPVGIRLAQALHHGTDHRSQICTALSGLGVEPPAIDVWDFGASDDRVVEIPPR